MAFSRSKYCVTLCLILGVMLLFLTACNRKDQGSNEQPTFKSPLASTLDGTAAPQAQIESCWISLADAQLGVSSATFQMPTSSEAIISLTTAFSASLYDSLNGFTLGSANISGYGPGFLGQAAIINGGHQYIAYSVGSQIPNSGTIEFYLYTAGYTPSYGANIIFTQCGYGGAYTGDIHLALNGDGTIFICQFLPGWRYLYSPPILLNQWVKIKAEFGVLGLKLHINDQLVCQDLSQKVLLSSRPLYFGTRSYWGPEFAIKGMLDEIQAYSGTSEINIVSPASGSVFNYGQPITFVGEKTGSVSNFQWSSDLEGGVISSVFPSFTTSTLRPGTHTITLSGNKSDGSLLTDQITIGVQLQIDEIKIRDLETNSFVSSLEMSSIKGVKNFQAIGFLNGKEVEDYPVPVTWSLSGGDVTAGTMRHQILTKLSANIGAIRKIGVFDTPTGAKDTVSNSDSVKFVSYLSSTLTGNIKIVANEGTVPQKEVSIRLKQPKIQVKFTMVSNVAPFMTKWFDRVDQTWGQQSILTLKRLPQDSKINVIFSNLEENTSEPFFAFFRFPQKAEFINPIVLDTALNSHYSHRLTVSRQCEGLFSRVPAPKEIQVYVVDRIYSNVPYTSNPNDVFRWPPLYRLPGYTICHDDYFMKTGDKVTDPSQSGLVLTNLRFGDSGNYSEFQARMLAHEIGHIILQPENEHFPDPKNLMSSSATGDELTATQFILALNYNNTKVPDSNFVIEE